MQRNQSAFCVFQNEIKLNFLFFSEIKIKKYLPIIGNARDEATQNNNGSCVSTSMTNAYVPYDENYKLKI